MAVADANSATTSQFQQLQKFDLDQFRMPSLHLLSETEEAREKYVNICIPLFKAALKGNWKAARHIIQQDSALLKAAITKGWATVLHVATGANHVCFVEELVKLMNESDLELRDYNGNTALCIAAAIGNVKIAEIMCQKNVFLPTIRGGEGMTPLVMAALQGRSEMAWYLYPKTVQIFKELDWNVLFLNCINTGLYDLALKLLEERPKLAFSRDGNNETGLHILARKPSCSGCSSLAYRKQIVNSCVKQNSVLQLVRCLWKQILLLDDLSMMKVFKETSQAIFYAAEVGNFEFLAELLNTHPDLIWEVDSRNRSIIHIAVLHRHASIFNLIHGLGSVKDSIISSVDDNKSNLLHLAAKLAPQDRLNLVSGAAFQMMLELLWFQEVKKIMQPSFVEMKNSDGVTPQQLFTMEHKELFKKAEFWIKQTSNSYVLVSTLIATSVFSAAFSIPGGYKDNSGITNYLEKPPFLIFALSNANALIASLITILIFLSISISRNAEKDFLRSLPLKLIFGSVTLFISIISMVVAFSSAFFLTYHHGLKWLSNFISVFAFVPILLFVILQFPIWFDVLHNINFCNSILGPSKHMLYYK